MEREIPTFEIEGLPHYVDVDCRMLRYCDNLGDAYSFSGMRNRGTHYELRIDTDYGEQVYDFSRKGKSIITINVPQMVELDPQGMAIKYSIPVPQLPQTDADLQCRQDLLAIRKAGKQPIIELEKHDFFCDIHWGLLRPKDDFSTLGLEMAKLPLENCGTLHTLLYDPKTHRQIEINNDLTSLPEGAVVLGIPYENVLDPFAVARRYDLFNKPGWFDEFPVRERFSAWKIPIENTSVRETILANIQLQKEQKQQDVKAKQIKRNKLRRG